MRVSVIVPLLLPALFPALGWRNPRPRSPPSNM